MRPSHLLQVRVVKACGPRAMAAAQAPVLQLNLPATLAAGLSGIAEASWSCTATAPVSSLTSKHGMCGLCPPPRPSSNSEPASLGPQSWEDCGVYSCGSTLGQRTMAGSHLQSCPDCLGSALIHITFRGNSLGCSFPSKKFDQKKLGNICHK